MEKKWITAASTLGAASLVFSAAALAQTPPPTPSVTEGTTATASVTGTVTEGTSATAMASGTAVSTGTSVPVSGTTTVQPIPTTVISANIYVAGGTGGFPFANSAFQNLWNRTDSLVAAGTVKRTWFWGPGPNTPGLIEQYNEDPSGKKQRVVQYFDKSRMELNNPLANPSQPFFVTNGLLTVELISGYIQLGDKDFVQYRPACIPMSGDFGTTLAPTYASFQKVSNTQAGDHNAPNRTGQNATDTIDNAGNVGNDPSKANVPNVKYVYYEPTTKHNIPAAFWDFLNSSGPVKNGNGQTVNEQLSTPWFYATGLPISEAYWATAKINGQVRDVLIQAYERRVLTYVPTNPAGFQVEDGNIGQHYFDWRYRNFGYCAGQPITTPTAPVPAPSGTAQATGTAVTTPQPSGTAGTQTPLASPSVEGTQSPMASPSLSVTVTASTTVTVGTTVTVTP